MILRDGPIMGTFSFLFFAKANGPELSGESILSWADRSGIKLECSSGLDPTKVIQMWRECERAMFGSEPIVFKWRDYRHLAISPFLDNWICLSGENMKTAAIRPFRCSLQNDPHRLSSLLLSVQRSDIIIMKGSDVLSRINDLASSLNADSGFIWYDEKGIMDYFNYSSDTGSQEMYDYLAQCIGTWSYLDAGKLSDQQLERLKSVGAHVELVDRSGISIHLTKMPDTGGDLEPKAASILGRNSIYDTLDY